MWGRELIRPELWIWRDISNRYSLPTKNQRSWKLKNRKMCFYETWGIVSWLCREFWYPFQAAHRLNLQRKSIVDTEVVEEKLNLRVFHSVFSSFQDCWPKTSRFGRLFTGWWLNQPIWKICSSNWDSSPNRGENKKYLKPPPSLWYNILVIPQTLGQFSQVSLFYGESTNPPA